jgi:hypothetical protein
MQSGDQIGSTIARVEAHNRLSNVGGVMRNEPRKLYHAILPWFATESGVASIGDVTFIRAAGEDADDAADDDDDDEEDDDEEFDDDEAVVDEDEDLDEDDEEEEEEVEEE